MPADSIIPLAFRFKPGADLRQSMVEAANQSGARAACVLTTVGSLRRARIRFAGKPDYDEITGDLEIVSLVGTLGPDGPHLHIAVSDANGKTYGGHMGDGCIVRTTAEVVIGRLPGVTFYRRHDDATGYRELFIAP